MHIFYNETSFFFNNTGQLHTPELQLSFAINGLIILIYNDNLAIKSESIYSQLTDCIYWNMSLSD